MSNPIRAHLQPIMREIGLIIGGQMPPGYGFCLLVFETTAHGSMSYISNAQRAGMIKALRELADKMDADK